MGPMQRVQWHWPRLRQRTKIVEAGGFEPPLCLAPSQVPFQTRRRPDRHSDHSVLHFDAFPIDLPGPAVRVPAVVSDQHGPWAQGLDQMQEFGPMDFAKNDVSDLDVMHVARFDGAQLSRLDLPRHRRTARPEPDRFAALKLLYVKSRPAHVMIP